MTNSTPAMPEAIECPLCLGKGELSRTEVLERLGMKPGRTEGSGSARSAVSERTSSAACSSRGWFNRRICFDLPQSGQGPRGVNGQRNQRAKIENARSSGWLDATWSVPRTSSLPTGRTTWPRCRRTRWRSGRSEDRASNGARGQHDSPGRRRQEVVAIERPHRQFDQAGHRPRAAYRPDDSGITIHQRDHGQLVAKLRRRSEAPNRTSSNVVGILPRREMRKNASSRSRTATSSRVRSRSYVRAMRRTGRGPRSSG